MGLYILAAVLYAVAFVLGHQGNGDGVEIPGALFMFVLGFAVLRTIWRTFNSGAAARTAGEAAAKVANQADTFKEAFREGRNK